MAVSSLTCLSVRQPWADLIVHGLKTDENRNWKTNYRGIVLIHSSSHEDPHWELRLNHWLRDEVNEFLRRRLISSHGMDRPKRNRILGAVIMTDCTQHNLSPWCEPGAWHHHFVEAVQFRKPIPFHKGQLRHFKYSELDRFSARDINQLNDLREKYSEICGMDLINASTPPPPLKSQDPEHKKFAGMRRDPETQKWIQDGSDPGHVTVRQRAAARRLHNQQAQRDSEQRKMDSSRVSATDARNKSLSPSGDPEEQQKRPHKPYRKHGRKAKKSRPQKPSKPKAHICKRYCEQFRPARYTGGFTSKSGPDTWPSCRLHQKHIRHIRECDVYSALLTTISKGGSK